MRPVTECLKSRGRPFLVAALLVAALAWVYWPVHRHDFIGCDDPDYVWRNPHVQAGLTGPNVLWALTTFDASNWHPLTWISHMLDVQLFGLNPGSHHLVNGLFHCANTLLLLLVLRRITGAFWRSALVAALFALHPLRVESVAWVAERKDVLSAFFFLLTLLAYSAYARTKAGNTVDGARNSPNPQRPFRGKAQPATTPLVTKPSTDQTKPQKGALWYLMALLCFAFGLMSKPMLVTLPFVLLLLDFWPLGRVGPQWAVRSSRSGLSTFWGLIIEKTPFFALTAISSVLTFVAQSRGYSIIELDKVPVAERVGNAVVSYLIYLKQMVWPAGLSPFYPFPKAAPAGFVAGSSLALLALSTLAVRLRRKQPHLTVGWFWYLGMLVPVIGLVQTGLQAHADRYTYLPSIGILLAVVWGIADLCRRRAWLQRPVCLLSGVVLAMIGTAAHAQVRLWRNTETLFAYALTVTTGNALAHQNLGTVLLNQGRVEEAAAHAQEALRIWPNFAEAHGTLGLCLALRGRAGEATAEYRAALKAKPHLFIAHYLLANALSAGGHEAEAIEEYRAALEIDPSHTVALNDLAWILATNPDARLRNGPAAVALAERACRLSQFRVPLFLGTLAGAYAAAGRFADAETTARQAVELAAAAGQASLAQKNRELGELYHSGKSYTESRDAAAQTVSTPAGDSK